MELRERVASIIMGDRDDMDDCRMVADRILALFTEELRGAFVAGAAWADGVIEWAGELDYSHATDAAALRYGGKS